jgi:hypothetical protein
MKLTQEDKKAIADSQKIHNAIGERLKKNGDAVKDKVDLTNIAKNLSRRREKVMRESDEE